MHLYKKVKRNHKLNLLLNKNSENDIFTYLDNLFKKSSFEKIKVYSKIIVMYYGYKQILCLEIKNENTYGGVFNIHGEVYTECKKFLPFDTTTEEEFIRFIDCYTKEKFNVDNELNIKQ